MEVGSVTDIVAVIVVTASVKDERGGQGHTSASLLLQSAM
jgi:hypothetical protein